MHAPSGSAAPVGQSAALALLALLLAACTATGSGDQAALTPPSTTVTTVVSAPGGIGVSFAGNAPRVTGHPAATATLDRVAAGLPPGCGTRVERSDEHLVSVVWRCGHGLAAATVTLAGQQLTLSDILTGGYAGYLSSVASAQFSAAGDPGAATGNLGTWYLTPAALAVAFPTGVVSYPFASLAPYLKGTSAL